MAIDTTYAAELGVRIRQVRVQRKMTLRGLADASGVSYSYLSEIESGISLPSVDKVQRLAKALKTRLSSLLPD